jgi:hypothetical protein
MGELLRSFEDTSPVSPQIPEPTQVLVVEVHDRDATRSEMTLDRFAARDLICSLGIEFPGSFGSMFAH